MYCPDKGPSARIQSVGQVGILEDPTTEHRFQIGVLPS